MLDCSSKLHAKLYFLFLHVSLIFWCILPTVQRRRRVSDCQRCCRRPLWLFLLLLLSSFDGPGLLLALRCFNQRRRQSLAIYPAMHIKPHDLYLPHCTSIRPSVCLSVLSCLPLSLAVCLCESARPVNSPAARHFAVVAPSPFLLCTWIYVRVQFHFSSALTVHI